MGTAKSLPMVRGPEPNRQASAEVSEGGCALVPMKSGNEGGSGPSLVLGRAAQIPVELDVAIPVREFRVRNLLALEPGQLIETRWASGEDMPLASGQVQLAWSEFEVQDKDLAVRITRLA